MCSLTLFLLTNQQYVPPAIKGVRVINQDALDRERFAESVQEEINKNPSVTIGEKNRERVLRAVKAGCTSLSEICEHSGLSRNPVMGHVKALAKQKKVVSKRKSRYLVVTLK